MEERAAKASDSLETVKELSRTTDADRAEARELILAYGWNATAYQILNPGIELWFGFDRRSVIGFVRYGRTRVVAGAPVCEVTQLDKVAAQFTAESHQQREQVCYFGAGDRLEGKYTDDPHWSRVLLGAQPSWDPNHWRDAIARRASLRAQFNRARNKGVRVAEWKASQAENHPALRRCLQQWLETRGLPPLHFLVEPETLSNLRDRRIFVALRGANEVVAFTVLSPVPARKGWLVEQIVRGHAAPNGTSELLLDAAVTAVAASGSNYITLGLSPLSERVNAPVGRQPAWLRFILRWVRLHGTRFYNFRGLDTFKAKFNPDQWEPIYAIAEGRTFPPRALYAIAGAFSGGNPIGLIVIALLRAIREEIRRLTRRRGHSAK